MTFQDCILAIRDLHF